MARQPSNETAVEAYLAALSRRLRFALPSEKIGEIVGETRAHLLDSVANLTEGGMEQSAAESAAVAGFGPVAVYSRSVVRSAYEDRVSVRARQMACVLGVCLAIFSFCWAENWTRTPHWLQMPWNSNIGGDSAISCGGMAFLIAFGAFAFLSFWGKRPQARLFGTVAMLLTAVVFINSGVNFVRDTMFGKITRKEIGAHRPDRSYQADIENDIRLLRLGCDVFSSKEPRVPASLLWNGHIIVPNVNVVPAAGSSDEALRPELSADQVNALGEQYDNRSYRALYRSRPYRVANDLFEAQWAWRRVGRPWLSARTEARNELWKEERHWALLQAKVRPGFSIDAAWIDAAAPAILLFSFACFEFVLSTSGRYTYRFLKNRRPGARA